MTNAILLDERDNVATCTSPAVKGGRFKSGGTISRPTFRLPKLIAAFGRVGRKISSGGEQS